MGEECCVCIQMGVTLSPIEETKSNISVVNAPTPGELLPPVLLHLIGYLSYSGPVDDEPDDKESHDRPNTPIEQGELLL